jgi:predicted permease
VLEAMRAVKMLRLQLRSLFRRRRVEQELADELRDHLERQIERHTADGMSPATARAAALREFGNLALVEEQVRDTRGISWLEDLWRDLAYAARSIRRAPGSTAVAALSLAAAIGANTTIFSLLNTLILRDLPVARPGELVELSRGPDGLGNFSYPLYERVRDENGSFVDLVAVSSPTTRIEIDQVDRPLLGRYVSGNFFEAFGLSPSLGRLISPDDDGRDVFGDTVAVISYAAWRRIFGADPSVIGRTLTVGGLFPPGSGVTFTIVGVAPRGFDGLTVGRSDDFYLPITTEPRVSPRSLLRNNSAGWLKVVGRLQAGVPIDVAKADADVIYARYLADVAAPRSAADARRLAAERLTVVSARAGLSGPRREFGRPVLLLMGAVALVLLVACANIVNLLLARGLARRAEIGMRLALGASRRRIVRQLLSEAALLGMLGGGAGLAVAWWGTPRIAALMANEDPAIAYDVSPDVTVLTFTAAVALGAALGAALIPALRVSRAAAPSLRDEASSRRIGAVMTLWTRGLIAAQVALSLLLLSGAFLLMATLRNFETGAFGFERSGVVTMRLEPGRAGVTGERRVAYFREVLARVRELPDVRGAAVSLGMPVIGAGVDSSFAVVGAPADPEASAFVNEVSDGYFTATGTRLLRGRDFGPEDRPGTPAVAIVNDALAQRYFGARNPVGQHIRVGRRGDLEIVGVVETTKYQSLRERDSPIVYGHALQGGSLNPDGGLNLVVKTTTTSAAVAEALRRAVQAAGPVPVPLPTTLASQIDRTLVRERLIARVLGAFAAVAVLLAAVGLYGVLAYAVTRRTGEIGVRLALGATRRAVLSPVVRQSLGLVALGVLGGVPAALAVTRVLQSLLYGVTPTDGRVLAGVVLMLFAVAMAAALAPAWRAARVNPIDALRCE